MIYNWIDPSLSKELKTYGDDFEDLGSYYEKNQTKREQEGFIPYPVSRSYNIVPDFYTATYNACWKLRTADLGSTVKLKNKLFGTKEYILIGKSNDGSFVSYALADSEDNIIYITDREIIAYFKDKLFDSNQHILNGWMDKRCSVLSVKKRKDKMILEAPFRIFIPKTPEEEKEERLQELRNLPKTLPIRKMKTETVKGLLNRTVEVNGIRQIEHYMGEYTRPTGERYLSTEELITAWSNENGTEYYFQTRVDGEYKHYELQINEYANNSFNSIDEIPRELQRKERIEDDNLHLGDTVGIGYRDIQYKKLTPEDIKGILHELKETW